MSHRKRKRIWVQSQVQGNLVLRCLVYWVCCLGTILLFVAVGTAFSGKLLSTGELFAVESGNSSPQRFWPAVCYCR